MAKTRKTLTKPPGKSSGRFICSTCGFKAAHAMGLGRHRSARHGVVSKRRQMLRSSSKSSATDGRRARAIESRLVALEAKYDRLVSDLAKALRSARR